MAVFVLLLALNSNTWPKRTSVVITAAASKYTATNPSFVCIKGGKISGKNSATRL